MKRGISVVIPNYNGRHLLPLILPTVFTALNNSKEKFEIIVSDDSSSDDSIPFLEKEYPEILVLISNVNKGFSPTINRGIIAAQYDYVLLLNSDVKLAPDYFAGILRYFDRDDTFGVMGRIVGWDDDKMQDAAKYPAFHGVKIKTSGNYYASQPKKDDWLFSMYLSGANALIDRNKLIKLGGLNELFAPFYVEDFELCLRAWRLGWKCYYDHFAVCHHKTSVTIRSGSRKNFINRIYYRNKMFLHAIHLSRVQLVFWYLQVILESVLKLVTLKFYYFGALKMFLLNKRHVKTSRRNFLKLSSDENTLLSVNQVVSVILNSVSGRSIERF